MAATRAEDYSLTRPALLHYVHLLEVGASQHGPHVDPHWDARVFDVIVGIISGSALDHGQQGGCTADARFAHHDFSLATTALKTHVLSLWVMTEERVYNRLLSSDARYRFLGVE
jgi:hypothetical protein